MTDAEKIREAAAQACDRIAGNTADFGRDYRRAAGQCAAMIRALPIPDASAPAADCQQAGLVTVDAGLLDEVKGILCVAKDEINAMPTHINLRNAERLINAALARLEREVG